MKTARKDISAKQKLLLLSLCGKYFRATKQQTTNATKEYNRLSKECDWQDINLNYVIAEAKDYFKRRPNSQYA